MADAKRFNLLVLAPPLLFAAIAGAFYIGMQRENPNELPSALAGTPAPDMSFDALPGFEPGLDPERLADDGVKLVNFWASWCGPCRGEHPLLTELAEGGLPVLGINYKDQTANAQAFLEELGNPYAAIGVDGTGRGAIEWGVYGVPETFVVDGQGQIVTRYPGPVTREVYEKRLKPAIDAVRAR
ncbi:MAG: DsbE family thiol:disulfide interchange protein [Pseudomonadota bacterium]